jgi:hypothetical protein
MHVYTTPKFKWPGVFEPIFARKHAPEAIETLADIAKNGTPGARVSAAIALLDRAYGKAPTFSTTDPGTFKRAIDMTDDELAASWHEPSSR